MRTPASSVACLLLAAALVLTTPGAAQQELGTKLAASIRGARPTETSLTLGMRLCSENAAGCAELTASALKAADEWVKGRGGCNVSAADVEAFKGFPRGKGAWEAFYKRYTEPKCLTDKVCRDATLTRIGANATTATVVFYQAPACGILCNPSSAKLNCGGGACPKVFGVGCAPKFDWKKKVFGH